VVSPAFEAAENDTHVFPLLRVALGHRTAKVTIQ